MESWSEYFRIQRFKDLFSQESWMEMFTALLDRKALEMLKKTAIQLTLEIKQRNLFRYNSVYDSNGTKPKSKYITVL